jgi:hypothetical protein
MRGLITSGEYASFSFSALKHNRDCYSSQANTALSRLMNGDSSSKFYKKLKKTVLAQVIVVDTSLSSILATVVAKEKTILAQVITVDAGNFNSSFFLSRTKHGIRCEQNYIYIASVLRLEVVRIQVNRD